MARPSTPLTREAIFTTALRLVDTHGADALSTNRIAAELGVKGPSLYNHVSGRADIIAGMLDLLVAEIDLTGIDERPWTVACDRLTRAYRRTLAGHPDFVPLIATIPQDSSGVVEAYERCFVVLREAGWAEEEVLPLVRSLEYLALASVLDRSFEGPDAAAQADATFDFGLAAMITGLEARLRTRRQP
ncbi:TetR/AcrR family transcriptional regulator [Nocardioides stalactiti]|uniref:TetR/AcrR family transcriptional regulator n=1 Tax=Nocardioides stalactiti TaxID=2755356 RepID=UPI001602D873|nr:TetR/AcrR family transcriptional regulator C-terminal domain-containing protein [Nocardioides stalactiti]